MPTEYRKAGEETIDALNAVIEEHFPEIANLEAPIRFEVLMALGDDDRPALKKNGHKCAAIISIIKGEERAAGAADIRLRIDRATWLDADEDTQRAILHHELMHLIPKIEPESKTQVLDAYGRPVVKLRRDDWMLSGFRRTVEIFGEAAIERQSLNAVEELLAQRTFDFTKAARRPRKAAGAESRP